MAARTRRIVHDENTRNKIRASQLINRLEKHVLANAQDGEVMNASQVTAALGLLRKVLPDLAAVEHEGGTEHTHYHVTDKPLTEDDWEARYGRDMAATEGATESPH